MHFIGCHNQSELYFRTRDQSCLSDHSCLYIFDGCAGEMHARPVCARRGRIHPVISVGRLVSGRRRRPIAVGRGALGTGMPCLHCTKVLNFHGLGAPSSSRDISIYSFCTRASLCHEHTFITVLYLGGENRLGGGLLRLPVRVHRREYIKIFQCEIHHTTTRA